MRPTFIGSTPNLTSIPAIAALTLFPFFTTTASLLTTILPFSIAVFMPADASSLITGPGLNGVGPALTMISFGATWPCFAGAVDMLLFKVFASLNGSSFVNNNAGIPIRYFFISSMPFLLSFTLSRTIFINLLLVILITTLPLSCPLIFCSWAVGRFSISTTPITG